MVSLINSGTRFVDIHHIRLANLANASLFNFLIYTTIVLVSNGSNAEQAMRKDLGPNLEMALSRSSPVIPGPWHRKRGLGKTSVNLLLLGFVD